MSVFENFKNIPRSPYGGRQGSNVIFFFFKFATKSLEKKKGPVAHPWGDRGPSPAVCHHSLCDLSLKIQKKTSPSRHSLCHLSLKIYEKNWSGCRVFTSFWNGGSALLLGHICLGKECDIWEFRDRRAEQWQLVVILFWDLGLVWAHRVPILSYSNV